MLEANYDSIHTGPRIDEAISRALPGGDIDLALSYKPNPNLLINSVFADGCLVDQRGGFVITPNTRIYSDAGLTNLLDTAGPNEYVRIQTVTEITDTYAKFIDSGGSVRYTEAAQAPVRGYTGEGVTIDRWQLNAGTLLVKSGGIQSGDDTFWLLQKHESYQVEVGQTYTISALIDGVLYTATGKLEDTSSFVRAMPDGVYIEVTLAYDSGSGLWYSSLISRQEHVFNAAKLELGDHQTLAHQDTNGNWVLNEIHNYADTFLRCVSSTADPSDLYANVPQRRNNRVIAVNTVNGLTTTVYSNDVTVTISVLGTPTESIGVNTALCGTLPVKYRPPIDYFNRIMCDDNSSNVVGINTAGFIANPVAALKAGVYHRLIMTYGI